jgi:hypothetical protein
VFREHAWLFGEGKGGGSSPPPAPQQPSGGPATGPEPQGLDLGEALDAVFAQHQQLFGKEAQP